MESIRPCHSDGRSGEGPSPALDADVHVWCVGLRHDSDLVGRARLLLSTEERERADAFRSPGLRDDFVVSRGSLRVLLSRLSLGAPADLRFTYGQQGKPALAGYVDSPVQFNISHSSGMLACAFARECDIGIDIEYQRRLADYEDIGCRFFSPSEYEELMSIVEPDRAVAFYDCWVRKEAFIKATGHGLSIPLDSFRVSIAPEQPAALLEVYDQPGEAQAWTIHSFSPAPQFSGAVALRDRRKRLRIHRADVRHVFVTAGLM